MKLHQRGIGIGSCAVLLLAPMVSAATSSPAVREEIPRETQRSPDRFEVGRPFPEIALPSLENGTPTTMAAFRGEKVILHVFASW